jgi:hypothetical protein
MLANAFVGASEPPTDAQLTAELGRHAKAVWNQLLAELADEYKLVTQEWNCYSRKAGWSLRLKQEKRNIVYFSPCRGLFVVSFALGDGAVEAARLSRLPERVMQIISEAKRYPEGTAVRINVNGPRDIPVVKKLVKVKLEN